MTVSQRIVAFLTLVGIGALLLYAAFQDSSHTGISIRNEVLWDYIRNADLEKLLDDIRTYLGILSVGSGIFIFLGRGKKS